MGTDGHGWEGEVDRGFKMIRGGLRSGRESLLFAGPHGEGKRCGMPTNTQETMRQAGDGSVNHRWAVLYGIAVSLSVSVVPVKCAAQANQLPANNAVRPSTNNAAAARSASSGVGPAATADSSFPTNGVYYVTAASLKVRNAPSAQAGLVAELGRLVAVQRLAETNLTGEGRWFRIRTLNTSRPVEGWMPATHLARTRTLAEGDFANLVYGPIDKWNYPNNPRRQVKALFVTQNTLTSERFRQVLSIVRNTAINALVVDFKDDDGLLLLPSSAAAARMNPEAARKSRDRDWARLARELKAMDVYLIARIVAFKDPIYAQQHPKRAVLDLRSGRTFQSTDGLMWASPYDPDFRAYNLALAEEAAAAGFNEVQYDYIRFPDVPRHARLDFRSGNGQSKSGAIQSFLLEARRRLVPLGVYLAADVFGLTCTTKDDMRIGQYWEAVANAVDYICPMMYPSHYAHQNYGLAVPDQQPYELVNRGIQDALRRNRNLDTPGELRPWLQGFTAPWVKGYRNYGPAEVKAQIRALANNGVHSFLIWHPGNKYDIAAYR